MPAEMAFGLLLPHFGGDASRERILSTSTLAEELGFDSLWARDHLVYRPHGFEDTDRTFVDAFVTLTAAGTATDLSLGTAVTLPHRHPLHLAQLYATLDFMVEGNVIAGFGLGGVQHEFPIVGLPFEDREGLHRENVEIMKRAWAGEADYNGEYYAFEDADQHPRPDHLPIWAGGSAPASVRRAFDYCDGWLPGRINMPSLKAGLASLRKRAEEAGRPEPPVGTVQLTAIAEDSEDAWARVDVEGVLETARSKTFWKKPPSGRFETVEDLDGVFAAGTPEDIALEVRRYQALGIRHLIFDLRWQFDEVERCVELLGDEVLPSV